MQSKVVNIIKPTIDLDKIIINNKTLKKRVCAYCRVSTDNIEQKTSYDAQVDEYTNRIKSNTNWEFIKVFADEGISGTSTKGRIQFNEMIERARDGEIDLIITKSIFRFARNTVDCLSYIRELRLINVEIYFEKENIYSSDPKVDFLLTIMSSIAQEEARNISENVKWNVQKRFKDGVPIVNHKRFLGYTKDKKGGNLVIVPKEAEAIRLVFKMYIEGKGARQIARAMEELGYKTGAGKANWRGSTVLPIIKNEKYCGDLLQQKTLTVDYLTHKQVLNNNIAPKFLIEDNHESIVDKETFELAQKIRKDRSSAYVGDNKNLSKYNN
ncbi:MAG: recombinase family protein [Bacilli bacterium]